MRVFFIILAIVLLLGAGYFTYLKWTEDRDFDTWSFIPESSAIVYESYIAHETFETLKESTLWSTLKEIDGFKNLQRSGDSLENFTNGQLSSMLDQNHLLISVHPISRDKIDFLFVLEISSIEARNQLSILQQHFENNYSRKTRTYLDVELTEIADQTQTFTFTFQKNYLVGSYSAFLVEDAIRTSRAEYPSFGSQFPELNEVTKLQQDQGNLYINLASFFDLINNYAELPKFNLGTSSFLDMQVTDQTIQFNGFTFPGDTKSILSSHVNIAPGSFDITAITPLQTSYMYHYSFADSKQWSENFQQFLSEDQPNTTVLAEKLKSRADLDINYIYGMLDEEIGLLHFEGLSTTDKALVLEVKDPTLATGYFDDLTRQFAQAEGDTILTDIYQGFELKLMLAEEFPQAILGQVAAGFPSTYYFTIDNFLVFSNSISQLQKIIDAIIEENTWAKSLRKNEFLKRVNQASNFSVFVNTPEFWSRLSRNITPAWKEAFNEYSTLIRSIDNIAFQFSQVDARFYTNVVFDQSEVPISTALAPKPIKTTTLKYRTISKPHLVKNHDNNRTELLVQDSANIIYLFNDELQLLWQKEIGAAMSSDLFQIDYYKNNKLQYLFVASDSLLIIDRNGDFLPEFPKSINGIDILNFNVIDYDGSRNYRFSFSDGKGNIYLTNKEGELLEGWNPNNLGNPIIQPLKHIRAGNRDVMIALTENGEVHLHNRRGESLAPFPLRFQLEINKPYYIKTGNNFGNSMISFVSKEGEWIKVDFNGNVRQRSQLFKPTAATSFQILNDLKEEYQLIFTQDEQGLRMLDPEGELLFMKEYLGGVPISTQFYRITAGKELVVVRDPTHERISIFNLEGQLLTGGPLNGSHDISLLYTSKDDKATIYVTYQNEIQKLELTNF